MNERCGSQNQALNGISVNAYCRMPDLLQDLVSFPKPLLVEQVDSFSQRFVHWSCRNPRFKGFEHYDLGNLGFEKTLRSDEIGLVCEKVEFDSSRAHSEVSDLICRPQQ